MFTIRASSLSTTRAQSRLLACVCFVAILLFLYQSNKGKNPRFDDDLEYLNLDPLELDCDSQFSGRSTEEVHITLVSDDEHPLKYLNDYCRFLSKRHFFPRKPVSKLENSFPLAYAVLVNENLAQLELFLSAVFMPQNFYCFHVDRKASEKFYSGVARLSKCFPNVILSAERLEVNSFGHNMSLAWLSCLQMLADKAKWKYVFTLQGGDFPLRTNAELVKILQLHDGSNDVELLRPPSRRYDNQFKTVLDKKDNTLRLVKTDIALGPPPANLTLYKGSVAATLSREFVDFILAKRLTTEFAVWLNKAAYGDEFFWATLNHDWQLRAPGGYPGWCLSSVGQKQWITRFAVWSEYKHLHCNGTFRHAVCLFSSKDLPLLATRHELFSNKFWSQTDAIPILCMRREIMNRTFSQRSHFNLSYYERLPAVQFAKWRRKNKAKLGDFPCVYCRGDCAH